MFVFPVIFYTFALYWERTGKGYKPKKLIPKEAIRKALAFFLLVVFLIGITPQVFFHDAFATHKDTTYHCNHFGKNSTHLHKDGFKCNFSGLVANSVYFLEFHAFSLEPLQTFKTFSNNYHSPHLKSICLTKENRGPPAIV
jgi:hypothetical protein